MCGECNVRRGGHVVCYGESDIPQFSTEKVFCKINMYSSYIRVFGLEACSSMRCNFVPELE